MPVLRVLGGGGEVGRAAVLLSDKGNLLLDYGINFDEADRPRFPLHVRPVDLTAVAISHAHLDHSGAAPLLFTTSSVRVIATPPTIEAMGLLVMDFLKLNGPYVDYELTDFEKLRNSAMTMNYGEKADLEGFEVTLSNAGHLIGSSMIYVETPSGLRVLYTGDVNDIQTWTLSGADILPAKVDVLIMESTYGARNHPPRNAVEKAFVEAVDSVTSAGGTVLVPAFSIGRAQEVAAMIVSQLPHLDVYVDGMARNFFPMYAKYDKYVRDPYLIDHVFKSVRFVRSPRERRKVSSVERGCVIISPAGMLKGGPSVEYVRRLGGDPKNAVLLVSYQAPNSPGHKLLEEGLLDPQEGDRLKARLEWYDLSSHAGMEGLLRLAHSYRGTLKSIVLIHGDDDNRLALAKKLREELGSDLEVHVPRSGDEIKIEG